MKTDAYMHMHRVPVRVPTALKHPSQTSFCCNGSAAIATAIATTTTYHHRHRRRHRRHYCHHHRHRRRSCQRLLQSTAACSRPRQRQVCCGGEGRRLRKSSTTGKAFSMEMQRNASWRQHQRHSALVAEDLSGTLLLCVLWRPCGSCAPVGALRYRMKVSACTCQL